MRRLAIESTGSLDQGTFERGNHSALARGHDYLQPGLLADRAYSHSERRPLADGGSTRGDDRRGAEFPRTAVSPAAAPSLSHSTSRGACPPHSTNGGVHLV